MADRVPIDSAATVYRCKMNDADPLGTLNNVVDRDTAEINALVEDAILAGPPMYTMSVAEARQRHDGQARAIRPQDPMGYTRKIETETGTLVARFFVPPVVRSALLYIHGGAWIMGDIDLADSLQAPRAVRAESAVVSIGYRLAPEHPWPAALADCVAAALWLKDFASRTWDTERLVISGDSAGAHLAVSTLLTLRDERGTMPFCGADLRYGMYDMRLSPSVRQYRGAVLDAKTLEWVLDQVFPPDDREQPLVSPLLAALQGLPQALFTVGTHDSLLDDTLMMWARWRAAGNSAELSLHPGGLHAFDYTDTKQARIALDRSVAFIGRCTAVR